MVGSIWWGMVSRDLKEGIENFGEKEEEEEEEKEEIKVAEEVEWDNRSEAKDSLLLLLPDVAWVNCMLMGDLTNRNLWEL